MMMMKSVNATLLLLSLLVTIVHSQRNFSPLHDVVIDHDDDDMAIQQQQQQPPQLVIDTTDEVEMVVDNSATSDNARLDSLTGGGAGVSDNYDPCYDRLTGVAQRCIPAFENVAYGKQVTASSTCGQTPMTYCTQPSSLNGAGGGQALSFRSSASSPFDQQQQQQQQQQCGVCDKANVQSASHLTDMEATTNATCWVSAPVYDPTQTANVSLHIAFGKKYELTYISMQFCTGIKPDSLSILKSMDYGKTWVPFQFYSSECKRVFGRPVRARITAANEQEAVCTDAHLQASPLNTNRIGFSTLEARPSFHEFDTSPVLQDWVTATDVKIVFNRLVSPLLFDSSLRQAAAAIATNRTLFQHHHHHSVRAFKRKLNSRHSRHSQFHTQMQHLGYYYAAVSELAIGGRCKCNGHASRCVLNE